MNLPDGHADLLLATKREDMIGVVLVEIATRRNEDITIVMTTVHRGTMIEVMVDVTNDLIIGIVIRTQEIREIPDVTLSETITTAARRDGRMVLVATLILFSINQQSG